MIIFDANKPGSQHIIGVGFLSSVLLSLELVLRSCLLRDDKREKEINILKNIKEGDVFPKNALIEANSFYEVINRFNSRFKDKIEPVEVAKITWIRNALGHGRILTDNPNAFPMRIYNFKKIPKIEDGKKKDSGRVKVIFAEEMNDKWFNRNFVFLNSELERVKKFFDSLPEN